MEGELSVVEAADYIGISERGLRDIIKRGELSAVGADPVRLAEADVKAAHEARRVDALATLARRRRTPVDLAAEVRYDLHRPHGPSPGLPGEQQARERLRLSVVPQEAKTLFGTAVLKAAASGAEGCRWCLSAEFARALGGWAPTVYGDAFAVLLGQPCESCWPGLYRPVMDALRVQIHEGATQPSAPAPRPSAEETRLAEEWVRQRAVTAAAKPRGDDDGKSLVARNLRTARARLKAAKRRGDQRDVLRLASMVRNLEADAARVDTASASRPGTLRCGHRLAAGCRCPRRASTRSQR